MDNAENNHVVMDEKNVEIMVTKFMPSTQYFDRSFDLLRSHVEAMREGQKDFKQDVYRRFEDLKEGQRELKEDMYNRFVQVDKRFEQVDKRFEQVDNRFEQVDKRFDQVDKRFEQVDKRFEQVDEQFKDLKNGQEILRQDVYRRFDQVNGKLDTIIERLDVKIDSGLRENRLLSFKLFSFAMLFSAISMAGLLGKLAGVF